MSKTSKTKVGGAMKSHLSRMVEPRMAYPKEIVGDYEVTGSEQVVENGRVVRKSVVAKVHPQDKMKGLKADDFALENIIAVGALDSLKECYYSANTTSELSDSMEGSIDNIIAAVDDAESNVEPKNNE